MKIVNSTQGIQFTVDDADYEAIITFKWRIANTGYPSRNGGKVGAINLHRHLLGNPPKDGLEVDHINGNKLDNQRSNLRWCTHAQNMLNKKIYSNNTSGFKGVSLHKQSGRWRVRIKAEGKYKHVGMFDSPESAYQAYQVAAKRYFGEFSREGSAC